MTRSQSRKGRAARVGSAQSLSPRKRRSAFSCGERASGRAGCCSPRRARRRCASGGVCVGVVGWAHKRKDATPMGCRCAVLEPGRVARRAAPRIQCTWCRASSARLGLAGPHNNDTLPWNSSFHAVTAANRRNAAPRSHHGSRCRPFAAAPSSRVARSRATRTSCKGGAADHAGARTGVQPQHGRVKRPAMAPGARGIGWQGGTAVRGPAGARRRRRGGSRRRVKRSATAPGARARDRAVGRGAAAAPWWEQAAREAISDRARRARDRAAGRGTAAAPWREQAAQKDRRASPDPAGIGLRLRSGHGAAAPIC